MKDVASQTHTTHATISAILRAHLPPIELRNLTAIKYSNSKLGNSNPMTGKRPPNFKGAVSAGVDTLPRPWMDNGTMCIASLWRNRQG